MYFFIDEKTASAYILVIVRTERQTHIAFLI